MNLHLIVEIPDKWDVHVDSPVDCIAGATFDGAEANDKKTELQSCKYDRSTAEGGYDARRQNQFQRVTIAIPDGIIPKPDEQSFHDKVCGMRPSERSQFAENNSFALLLLSESRGKSEMPAI